MMAQRPRPKTTRSGERPPKRTDPVRARGEGYDQIDGTGLANSHQQPYPQDPNLTNRLVTPPYAESRVDPNIKHTKNGLPPPQQTPPEWLNKNNEEVKDQGRIAKVWSKTKSVFGYGPKDSPKATTTGFEVGDNGNINIKDSKINLETKISYGLKVFQAEKPTDEYIKGAVLEWTKPQKPSTCQITDYQLIILDDCGEIVREKIKHCNAPRHQVPDKTLKSGSNYFFSVDTIVKYRDGDVDTFKSDELRFSTRPGKPRIINVKCNENTAEIQWSTCRGAEKFSIELLSDQKESLDKKETFGSFHKCKFDIDPSRGIHLGKNYDIIVTAYKSDWKNTGTMSCFFGDDASPKSVVAQLVEGKNEVDLSWKAPESSSYFTIFSKSIYEVEVVNEDGKTRKLDVTNKQSTKVEDLKGGMTYYFRVASVNKSARSFWSTSNSIKTKKCEIKVENFRVETNKEDPARSLRCSWDTVDGAVGFKLQYKCRDKSCTVRLNQTDSNYVIKDLEPHTTYSMCIKAEDGHGFGPYSQTATVLTGLGTPTDVSLKVFGKRGIRVAFKRAKNATSHKVVLVDEDGDEKEEKTDGDVAIFKYLPFNTKVTATVTAIYKSKEGDPSPKETILTAPAPPRTKDASVEIDESNPTAAFWLHLPTYENCTNYQAQVTCCDDKDENILLEMEKKNEKFVSVRYRCLNEGAEFYSKLRMQNEAGYSDWSERIWIITAPNKVEKLTLEISGDNLIASWESVRHAEKYKLTLYKDGEELEDVEGRRPGITFDEKLSHGFSYHCVIIPENTSGCGPKSISNKILAPLDLPTDLEMKDLVGQAQFSWTKSKGMRTAEIWFEDSSYQGDHFCVSEETWCSPPVTLGEVYELKIWAKNGKARSKQHGRMIYCTAPSKVITVRNEVNPETSLDFRIDSKHPGPFLITWKDINNNKISACITQTSFTIEGLRPATEYRVSACCIYGKDYQKKSERCYGEYVMTLPAKVTGVKCLDEGNGSKKLIWNSCGNDSVEYKMTWSKDDVFFKPKSTFQPFFELPGLQPGKYEFRISAGGGKSSDICCAIVPPRPQEINAFLDKDNPEECIMVYFETPPPCVTAIVTAEDPDGSQVKVQIDGNNFTKLRCLQPGTQYLICCQLKSGENWSEKVHIPPVRTVLYEIEFCIWLLHVFKAFPKVSGVRSTQQQGVGDVKLEWDSVDGDCDYIVRHQFEQNPPTYFNTIENQWIFHKLPSGHHSFAVRAENGADSNVHHVFVPHQIQHGSWMTLSSQKIGVVCRRIPDASYYKFELWRTFDETLISSSEDLQNPEFTFDVEYGYDYEIKAVAYWKENGQHYYGSDLTMICRSEHNIPEMIKLTDDLNRKIGEDWLSSNEIQFVEPQIAEIQENDFTVATKLSDFMNLRKGERCILIGPTGKTTILMYYLTQETSFKSMIVRSRSFLSDVTAYRRNCNNNKDASRITSTLLRRNSSMISENGIMNIKIDLSQVENLSLELYFENLAKTLNLSVEEGKNLLDYVMSNPENVTILIDLTQQESSGTSILISNLSALIHRLPNATFLAFCNDRSLCNVLRATRVAFIQNFENQSVALMTKKIFSSPSCGHEEVSSIIDDFPFIRELCCQNKQFCATTLQLIMSTLRGEDTDVDFNSKSSVLTAVLLKSVSTKYGIDEDRRKKLLTFMETASQQSKQDMISQYFNAWKKLVGHEDIGHLLAAKSDEIDHGILEFYCGLLRQTVVPYAEKLFGHHIPRETWKKKREQLNNFSTDKNEASGVMGKLALMISTELNEPYHSCLKFDLDMMKTSQIHKQISHLPNQNRTYTRHIAISCGEHPKPNHLDLNEKFSKLPKFSRIGLLSIKKLHMWGNSGGLNFNFVHNLQTLADRLRIVHSELRCNEIKGICSTISNNISKKSMFALYELRLDGNKNVANCLSDLNECASAVMTIYLLECNLTESLLTGYEKLLQKFRNGMLFI